MLNKDLPHSEERSLILSSVRGVIGFGGTVEIDNDDENGHFTLTQTWFWGDKRHTRTIKGQLLITEVEEKQL